MRYYLLFLFIFGCGTFEGDRGSSGNDGNSCTVVKQGGLTTITCEDGTITVIEDGEDGINGESGINGVDGENFIPVENGFQGYWIFPNGGYLELLENSEGRILMYGTQRLYSINFDTRLALHPNLPTGPHHIRSDRIVGEYNVNYNTTTNDVERDGTTTNISGVRKTVYILEKVNTDLQVTLFVYYSSGLQIEAHRVLISQ